ncbi:MAG: hypothetical protein ACHQT8_07005 [Chlamydiales bacterium]
MTKFGNIHTLFPHETKERRDLEAKYLFVQTRGYATLGMISYVPALALRIVMACVSREPFIHASGGEAEARLRAGRVVKIDMQNIACVAGGFVYTDAGLLPWQERIPKIADQILKCDSDVCIRLETFDTGSAFYLRDRLHGRYAHFYFNIGGVKVLGPSSGIFVASKFAICDPEFTQFTSDMKVERTRFVALGVFGFTLMSDQTPFMRVFVTHLQPSQETSFPTSSEKACREKEMRLIGNKIDQVKGMPVIFAGDMNMDRLVFNTTYGKRFEQGVLLWHEIDHAKKTLKTWGGDALSAMVSGHRISMEHDLDFIAAVKGSVKQLRTALAPTDFKASQLTTASSDHAGLVSTIKLHGGS